MRILSRFSDILFANINLLLDKAEDPEAMIGQIIREMEEDLALARGHAASAIAAERWLNRELAKQRAAIDYWQTKARAAVAANRDDLARVALVRKKDLEPSTAELAIQHTAAVETCAQARASLDALEANLGAAMGKRRSLIARHRAAQARRALGRARGKRLGAAFSTAARLEQWEQRMIDLEDTIVAETEVQGLASAETTFAEWETEADIDRELSALKEENTVRDAT